MNVPAAVPFARSPDATTPAPLPARVPMGRVVELSGAVPSGRTTVAVGFVLDAQRHGDPVAWVQCERGGLYPPDLADAGVDLDALAVVQVPRDGSALARAGELLLRSGGFGLVVLDLTPGTPRGSAWIVRLGALARHHHARVVLLTASDAAAPSAGALVAVRAAPTRTHHGDRYALTPAVLRDRCDLAPTIAPTRHPAPWQVLR